MKNICPICDSSVVLKKINTGLCKVTTCGNCSHEYTQKKDIIVAEKYNKNYFNEVHKNWFANPQIKLFKLISKIIRENFDEHDLKILDVGCGKGALLYHLEKSMPETNLTGIDVSDSIKDIKSNVNIIQTTLNDFKSNVYYDVIISTAVIEHLDDVKMFLIKIKKLLKINGIILIATNDTDTPLYKLAKIFNILGIKTFYRRLYDPHHLNHFNKKNLGILARNVGLRSIFTNGINVPLKSLDIPSSSKYRSFIYKIAVRFLFFLGAVFNHHFFQIHVFIKD